MAKFAYLFPKTPLSEIPQSVWDEVESGGSLSASYALHLHILGLEEKRIAEQNESNRRMSSGSLTGVGVGGYYSPEEVRRMTPSQVRENYDDVIDSMRHWH